MVSEPWEQVLAFQRVLLLMTSYQLADAETIKNVVLHPTNRIVSR